MGATEKLKEQTGLAKKPVTIHEMLESMKPQIAMALPKHLTPERMVRIALTCLRMNPDLAECDPQSILASIMLASQLGLEPGVLGQCFLIPFKGHCTLVPGWLGILDMVNRAGKATAWTGAVYAGDDFEWALGDKPFVTHRPSGEESALTHVYAIARVKGSEFPIIEVWPMSKLLKHREKYNRVGDKHYSYKHFEMYARKVALLQVLKYVPRSIELATAFQLDATAEMGTQHIDIKDVPNIIEGAVVQQETEDEPKKQPEPEICASCSVVGGHAEDCKYHPANASSKAVQGKTEVKPTETPTEAQKPSEMAAKPSQKDWARLHANLAKKGVSHEELATYYRKAYKVESGSQLTLEQFAAIEKEVSGWKEL